MPAVLPYEPNLIDQLRAARGYVDVDWNEPTLSGWVLCPDRRLDAVRIWSSEAPIGEADLHSYAEISRLYPNIPYAAMSGFHMAIERNILPADRVNPVTILGYFQGQPVARRDALLFHDDLMTAVPTPPPELIGKTQDGNDPYLYQRLGHLYYHQLRNVLARYRELTSLRRVLDFGCGSGRVLANFLADPRVETVAGADIDPDAIAWGRANLPGAEWSVIDKVPPLPYPDAGYDCVISLAVFAAFGPDEQRLWLPELQRVIAPGGFLLVSIQGTFSASFLHPRAFMTALRNDGIIDRARYHAMKDSLGLGEYLGVYQTRAYTWREWSRSFEILEHLEGEIGADQDLVVMRRRA